MAVLLAFLFLLAPVEVDERLLPAWELLAALPDHGAHYADIVERTGVRLVIGPEPPTGGAMYLDDPPRVVVHEALLAEDVTVVASVLAHELEHANQDPAMPCLEREARAFAAQAEVWRALWPDGDFPTGTPFERALRGMVRMREAVGLEGMQRAVEGNAGYRRSCGVVAD